MNATGQADFLAYSVGWKADLIVRKARDFSEAEFARRQRDVILGVAVATPEDTVLAKLEWARLSGSVRQIEDAAGVLRVSREVVDAGYLEQWAEQLGVEPQLAEAGRAALG